MAEPISYTDVKLMSGVPFNVDFKHTRWFYDENAQTTYFNSKPEVYHTPTANFQRLEGRFTFKCPLPIEQLENANYLRFFNNYGMKKYFYCFITQLEYSSRGMTIVHFELDPLQTFMFRMNFKPSYVEREHSRLFFPNGLPNINTQPENLHYGEEYFLNHATHIVNPLSLRFFVIISKDALHGTESTDTHITPSYITAPQPLYYYVIPFKPDGSTVNVFDTQELEVKTSEPHRVIDVIHRLQETVNSVVSMYVTEDIGLPILSASNTSLQFDYGENDITEPAHIQGTGGDGEDNVAGNCLYIRRIEQFKPTKKTITENVWNMLSGQYAQHTESKLMMTPYTWIELHDFRGNTLRVRPEMLQTPKLVVVRMGSLGISNKVSYHIENYNQSVADEGIHPFQEVAYEHSLIDNTPHDISVKNEHLAAFMQGNRNQLINQRNSAIMDGIFSTAQAGVGMASGLSSGDKFGVASAGVQGAQGISDATLKIQGIQAQKKDIANVPASISKMGNNTAFDIGNGYYGVYLVVKTIRGEYKRVLGDFFNMYGYKINEVKVPNFRSRQSYNHVKTIDCIIRGDFPNKYIEQLKAIFNNGITLWHTEDIGNYALSNNERE